MTAVGIAGEDFLLDGAPTYAGRTTGHGPQEAASLQLARAGVPVARLRAGDDVGAVLSATRIAHGVANA